MFSEAGHTWMNARNDMYTGPVHCTKQDRNIAMNQTFCEEGGARENQWMRPCDSGGQAGTSKCSWAQRKKSGRMGGDGSVTGVSPSTPEEKCCWRLPGERRDEPSESENVLSCETGLLMPLTARVKETRRKLSVSFWSLACPFAGMIRTQQIIRSMILMLRESLFVTSFIMFQPLVDSLTMTSSPTLSSVPETKTEKLLPSAAHVHPAFDFCTLFKLGKRELNAAVGTAAGGEYRVEAS